MSFDIEEARKKWQLTDEEFNKNMDEIFAELSLLAEKQEHPTFVFVGGQAGSGKSVLVAKENQNLNGRAIIIDQDELRPKYPRDKYKKIHDSCTEREEFLLLKPYISRAVRTLEMRAVDEGYNIILESALRSVSSFIDTIQELKESGYRTKLSVLATPEVEANLSMLTRYCYYLQRDGECRRNTRLDHDAVERLRMNIQRLDELGIFDDITISMRGKRMDALPIEIYAKQKNVTMTPLQAYDYGVRCSFEDTAKNFQSRYNQIRTVLMQYNEMKQLEKLEEIKNAFDKEEGR